MGRGVSATQLVDRQMPVKILPCPILRFAVGNEDYKDRFRTLTLNS